MVLSLYEKER